MSADDHVEVICPYCDDGTRITAHVDTNGDPDVGMPPDGIWRLDGTCIHAVAINDDLEHDGGELLGKRWPSFVSLIHHHYNELARQDADFERMMNDQYGEDQWS